MYSYIKGEITEIKATHITIENNEIGYLIKVPNPYAFSINSKTTIYIHHHVREDAVELFGFSSSIEKETFEKLISVKGLGPKGALAILASATPSEIAAATNDANSKFFVKFPGIGPKLSQQIILDLKGKIDFENQNDVIDERLDQIALALKSLGYNQAEIKNVIKNIKLEPETSISDAIKIALKMLRGWKWEDS